MLSTMRSPRGFVAALITLVGVLIAAVVAITGGDGAEPILHVALGAAFVLIAWAVFDFGLPGWFAVPVAAALAVLAAIFLLQAAADLTHAAGLVHLAFEQLGQTPEKVLGYAFLLWCAAVLWWTSGGMTRIFGVAVLAVVAAAELYVLVTAISGGSPNAAVKLLYVPLFAWLLLESRKAKPV